MACGGAQLCAKRSLNQRLLAALVEAPRELTLVRAALRTHRGASSSQTLTPGAVTAPLER